MLLFDDVGICEAMRGDRGILQYGYLPEAMRGDRGILQGGQLRYVMNHWILFFCKF